MDDIASIIEQFEKRLSEYKDKIHMLENRIYQLEDLTIIPGNVRDTDFVSPNLLKYYVTDIVVHFNDPEFEWVVKFTKRDNHLVYKYTSIGCDYYANLINILRMCKKVTKLRLENFKPEFMGTRLNCRDKYYICGYEALFNHILNVFPNIEINDNDREIINSFIH